jgi:predicted lipid-binding transport protein (Tim44 family)
METGFFRSQKVSEHFWPKNIARKAQTKKLRKLQSPYTFQYLMSISKDDKIKSKNNNSSEVGLLNVKSDLRSTTSATKL